jgi:MFS superfamily sulfate permease-like transporter
MTARGHETEAVPAAHRAVKRWVPGLATIASYRRKWLAKDIVAGIVLSTLLVPQGMAYAELAGLPPITGLYTSVLCLLGYAVFGPSRILVLGPDSALGSMIAATILPLAGAGATRSGRSRWRRCWRSSSGRS